MALVLADRVNETTTTAGTGTLTLAGAVSGYQSFSVIGNANTTYYTIVHQTANEWEVGIGTYTSVGTTLSRDTVLASSAGGTTKVTFSAGTKFVFCDYPAGRAVYLDTASNATIPGITLSGGTANGVAYLNGSKVLTTGSALTFDGSTLTATTTSGIPLVVTGTGSVGARIVGGTGVGAGAYINLQAQGGNAGLIGTEAAILGSGTSTNLMLYGYGSNSIVFAPATVEGMRLTSTGLGIGTSSPGQKLTVQGGLNVTSSATLPVAQGSMLFSYESAVNRCYMGDGTGYSFAFSKRAASVTTDLMTLNDSGNLGIGTSSPGDKLTVSAGRIRMDQDYQIVWQNAGTNRARVYGDSGSNIIFETGSSNTEGMRLNSSGNLLVGTTSVAENGIAIFAGAKTFTSGIPQYQLQAQDTTAMAAGVGGAINFTGKYTSGGAITSFASIEASKDNATSGNFGAAMVFKTRVNGGSQTEAMRIDSSQNVGIGTSSPSQKLNVATASGNAYMRVERASQTTGQVGLQIGGGTSGTDWLLYQPTSSNDFRLFGNSADRVVVTSAGNFTINAPSSGESLTVNTVAGSGIRATAADLPRIATVSTGVNAVTLAMRSYDAGPFGIVGTMSNHALNFRTNDVDRMVIDTSGNVGIGTSSPSEKLSVAGNTTADIYKLRSNTSAPASTDAFVFRPADNTLAFGTASSERARIDSSGNLGIGTSSPGYKLDVNGSINIAAGTFFRCGSNPLVASNGSTLNYQYAGTTALAWRNQADTTELMRLDSSGNLGLGVTPSVWSQGKAFELRDVGFGIWNGTQSIYSIANAYFNGGFKYANTGVQASHYYQYQGQHVWSTAPSGTAGTAISFTQAMTLDSSGNLLVGTTSASGRLTVRQDSTTASPLYIVNAAVSGKFASFEGNGAVQGSITWSGSTTAYNTTSDQRLKENITDADSASDLIDAIKVRQFDWKADGTHQRYGMIAQELHEVAPEAVYAPADPEDMMAVDYSKLVPMLIKEIQSLRQRVAQLEVK